MSATVLVVDDEPAVRFTLKTILTRQGLTVLQAADGRAALDLLADNADVDLIISDLKMPQLDGMGLLGALRERPHMPRFIMITAHGDERMAVAAIKAGAADYFSKPFDAADIIRVVRRAVEAAGLQSENRRLRANLALSRHMVFESAAMERVAQMIERAAGRDVTVLIQGESGTGKELVARALVDTSKRASKAFIRFNCAALPRQLAEAELFGHRRGAFTGADQPQPGLFRAAEGGTLLLDEIDSLDPAVQASLLRVLQEREVRPVGETRAYPIDVRVIAAGARDLSTVETFRRDLYYRLNVLKIRLPPLRERPEDIEPLAHHFARQCADRFQLGHLRLTPRLLARLRSTDWPGNVRELQHAVERLCILATGPEIDGDPFADDGPTSTGPASLKQRMDVFERQLLSDALRQSGGNQSECARRLDLSRPTLLAKLRKHGLR